MPLEQRRKYLEGGIYMADIIVAVILLIVISLAVCYIIKARKKGEGCIGCPNASKCGGDCSSHKI